MKKIYLMLSSFLLLVLVACGNEDSQATGTDDEDTVIEEVTKFEEKDETEEEHQEPTEEDIEEKSSTEKDEIEDETDETDEEVEKNTSELDTFEEYSVLKDNIDLDEYQPDIKENNSYKRIMIFKNSKNKEGYKSIYIKKENRFKLIEFDKGLIYNEKI